MELLKKEITEKGKVLSDHILKVDSFLNHQINVSLMQEIGKEFKTLFQDIPVTKVITVESSGIAPAVFTALAFGVDAVFARKKKSLTLQDNILTAEIYSYTKEEWTTITISKDYVKPGECLLVIDDFLANGEVAKGLVEIVEKSGATIGGIGIVIEKSFQKGRAYLDATGIRVESLARIQALSNGVVTFLE